MMTSAEQRALSEEIQRVPFYKAKVLSGKQNLLLFG